jgi:UDP-N-acetylmuramoyl-tripeptide--D-alanyl-D-alanine ligase
MKASIDVINTALSRKVCILGDMFELGADEKKLHYGVGEYLAQKEINFLIAVGSLAKEISNAVEHYNKSLPVDADRCQVYYFETRDEMLVNVNNIIKTGDTILVKASHGMEFNKVVEFLAF